MTYVIDAATGPARPEDQPLTDGVEGIDGGNGSTGRTPSADGHG